MFLIIGIVAVVVLAALGGGGALANASLSSTYNAQRSVSDYFSAMSRGDASGMLSNATFLVGDSTYSQFFTKDAVKAMLSFDQGIKNVQVGAASTVDDSTDSVNVSLSWGGTARNLTYKVRKDSSRVHYLFYPSWLVQVPFITIAFGLPNQAGRVQVDGLSVPADSTTTEAIQGIHSVSMAGTDFYDSSTRIADGVDRSPTIQFPTDFSASARAAAVATVKAAFGNVTCDATKYFDCPNHRYTPAAGQYDILSFPGGDIDAYSSWSLAFAGDPTTNMKLTASITAGKVDASGTCGMTMTVDGSKTYNFVGVWTGTLTWVTGAFNSDVTVNCDTTRA